MNDRAASPSQAAMTDPADPGFVGRLRRAAEADVLLVATDFDGTIAPFMDDPEAVRPAEGAIESLVAMAQLPRTTCALVSGRDLDTLARLSADPAGVVLVGSHGGQSTDPRIAGPGELTAEQQATMAALSEGAQGLAARHPGLTVEHKAAAVVIHVRQMDESLREQAMLDAERTAREKYGVEPMLGKNVVEASVLSASKGSALLRLAGTLGADAVVYLGDDVTDETVFEAFRDRAEALMVKIGEGDSAGNARLSGPAEAVATLVQLTSFRKETARTP